jgi:GNAT superfamily N-acetyltransferase
MDIKYGKLIDKSDLEDILKLQRLNLRQHVPEHEKSSQGFVFVSHSLVDLDKLNQIEPHIIAKEGEHLVGYCLAMTKHSRDEIPSLVQMFEEFDSLSYQNKKISESNYLIVGQVCVAKEYRGKGIFRNLYKAYRTVYAPKYEFVITEISTRNLRSLTAHQKMGFQIIKTYQDEFEEWAIVIWDWN